MTETVSARQAWIMAARPHTLPAAAAPVIVGTAVAVHLDLFAPLPALFALIGAGLIQIGTNLANDYYDAVRGADTEEREGFTRVTQAGILPPRQVKRAAALCFGLAILTGTYLVVVGGLPVVVIGLTSVLCGWAYTGGPVPLGYLGLGDLFVFVFFGIVAVVGTVYVQAVTVVSGPLPVAPPAGTLPLDAVLASFPIGALATAILVVNNIRDRETDAAAGKRTLAVRLGYRFSRLEYGGLLGLAYVVPLVFLLTGDYGPSVLLPFVTVPYAVIVTRTVLSRTDAAALDPALERTGRLLALFALTFAVGVVLA